MIHESLVPISGLCPSLDFIALPYSGHEILCTMYDMQFISLTCDIRVDTFVCVCVRVCFDTRVKRLVDMSLLNLTWGFTLIISQSGGGMPFRLGQSGLM